MILPTKFISPSRCLLAEGASLLTGVQGPTTIGAAWAHMRSRGANYERFVLALDLLFIMGAIEVKEGLIVRLSE